MREAASDAAPTTMSLLGWPAANSAPPHDTCTMPSLSASANPRIAATMDCDDVQLTAGYANAPAFARSNISA